MSSFCYGICIRYQVSIPHGESPYDNGRKYCTKCGQYMKISDKRCPCCKTVFRTRPRKNRNNHIQPKQSKSQKQIVDVKFHECFQHREVK